MSQRSDAGGSLRAILLAAGTLFLLAPAVAAQSDPPSPSIGGLEAWGGYSANSPQWGQLGEAPGLNLALLGVRWTRALGGLRTTNHLPRWEYGFELIPLARISPPLVSLRGTGVPCTSASLCVLAPDPNARRSTFPIGSPAGMGASPIVLVRRFDAGSKASFTVGATAGLLWFEQRVPTTKASRLNATAAVDLGMRIGRPGSSGVTFAYRLHHFSNAGRAGENPGMASHLFSVGLHQVRLREAQAPGTSRDLP